MPQSVVEALERRYRTEIGDAIAEAHDDALFARAVTDACAHWALTRWAGLWQPLFKCTDGATSRTDAGGDDLDMARSQAFTVYRSFVDVATETDYRLPIAEMMNDYAAALMNRFPELGRTPVYRAFAPA